MTWYYLGGIFTPNDIGDHKAFVYQIYNKATHKLYIGKKRFVFTRSVRRKGRKNCIRRVKTSDWENYYGSCKELLNDIEKYGADKCSRLILKLCKTPAEASYYELKKQLEFDVLLRPQEYYNNYVGARIHRNHLIKK